jgi:hypothetical protein
MQDREYTEEFVPLPDDDRGIDDAGGCADIEAIVAIGDIEYSRDEIPSMSLCPLCLYVHKGETVPLCPECAEGVETTMVELPIPTCSGTRGDGLWTLARVLRNVATLEGDAGEPGHRQRKRVVREWHGIAGAIIEKSFDEAWAIFCHAWQRVEYPAGTGPLERIDMETIYMPPEAGQYTDPAVKKLVALCYALEAKRIQDGQDYFYLACRAAADKIGVKKTQANNYLLMLVADGVLVEVEKGGRVAGKPAKASRFRFARDIEI